jgi:uncharacterized protein YdeI (YjbR/CyaY-like superfamily)
LKDSQRSKENSISNKNKVMERNILYFTNFQQWYDWLAKNFQKEKEIWLKYPKKESKTKRISYNDAVEAALCFDWIDSTIQKYGDLATIQRFTPRNPKSSYSQANKERLRFLSKNCLIHSSITEKITKILQKKFIFPKDILKEIQKDKLVWSNYNQFSDSYKRIRIAYVENARKKPEEFQKRLKNFISKTQQNKMIGFGGIEKHY